VFDRTQEPPCPTFLEEVERLGLDEGNDPCLTNSLRVRFSDTGDIEAYLCGAIGFLVPEPDGLGVLLYSTRPGFDGIHCQDGVPTQRVDSSYGCLYQLFVECGDEQSMAEAMENAPASWCYEVEGYDPRYINSPL